MFDVGVTVGKFYPFHKGHAFLIREAVGQCRKLYVVIGDRGDDFYQVTQRATWIRKEFPQVTVIPTRDDLPDEPGPWAERVLNILPEAPDVAFTSEDYGPGWADAMGVPHVFVGRDRLPISGTEIRQNIFDNLDWLPDATKLGVIPRFVVVGAESTGTTTLARSLAQAYKTVWVPEYGRYWWEARQFLERDDWSANEFESIVMGQIEMEDRLALEARKLLICDTDALVTIVFERRYRGGESPFTELTSEARVPAGYIITGDEIPWVQDGARESGAERADMQEDMRRLVADRGVPFIEVSGGPFARLTSAALFIEEVLENITLAVRGESEDL